MNKDKGKICCMIDKWKIFAQSEADKYQYLDYTKNSCK